MLLLLCSLCLRYSSGEGLASFGRRCLWAAVSGAKIWQEEAATLPTLINPLQTLRKALLFSLILSLGDKSFAS